MKLKYTTPDKRFQVEFDAANEKEMIKQVARFQEIFEINTCGHCTKNNLRFSVRNIEDNDFYELQCRDCGYQLAFGQHKKNNTLFPKTWSKWTPDGGEK